MFTALTTFTTLLQRFQNQRQPSTQPIKATSTTSTVVATDKKNDIKSSKQNAMVKVVSKQIINHIHNNTFSVILDMKSNKRAIYKKTVSGDEKMHSHFDLAVNIYNTKLHAVDDDCVAFCRQTDPDHKTTNYIDLIHTDSKKDFSFEVTDFSNLFFTSNGQIIVCCHDKSIYSVDYTKKSLGNLIYRSRDYRQGEVNSVAISPDKNLLIFIDGVYFYLVDLTSNRDWKSTEIAFEYNPRIKFINNERFFILSKIRYTTKQELYSFKIYRLSVDRKSCAVISKITLSLLDKNSQHQKSNFLDFLVDNISISPNGNILAIVSRLDKTISCEINMVFCLNFYNLADLQLLSLDQKSYQKKAGDVLHPFHTIAFELTNPSISFFKLGENPWTNKGEFIFFIKNESNNTMIEKLSFTPTAGKTLLSDRQTIAVYEAGDIVHIITRDDEVEIWQETWETFYNENVETAEEKLVWKKVTYTYLEYMQKLNNAITNALAATNFQTKDLVPIISHYSYDKKLFQPALSQVPLLLDAKNDASRNTNENSVSQQQQHSTPTMRRP